ncbi:hypothetical protein [Paraburkholderia aromaticivorans]|uniref:hypothetical protein n=1 Tax=Paraburkholderia aromaticivorans TaxID=2026199 RepID=UPI0014561D1F|nr:hypothetical protein [Paraburkholderia aromaticivorans]
MSDTETTDRETLNSSESSADDSSESSRSKKTQEARDDEYDVRLTNDLERLLRYASTAKDIDVPKDILEEATKALQVAKSSISERNTLDQEAELALFKSIDSLSPKVYPATAVSLEIAEVMEIGSSLGTPRQQEIRTRVKNLIGAWNRSAFVALGFVFVLAALKAAVPPAIQTVKLTVNESLTISNIVAAALSVANPMILGFLGACAFILRRILQGLANQTFVLREGSTYLLRAILGIILGYMVPLIYATVNNKTIDAIGLLGSLAIPFLAGYAVEAMFAALDTIVLTIRDAVSRESSTSNKGPLLNLEWVGLAGQGRA